MRMITLWLGRVPSLAFKVTTSLIGVAVTSLLAFLPDVAKSTLSFPLWVFGLVLVFVILLPVADHIREQNQFWPRLFRYGRNAQIVTGVIMDEHGEETVPPHDREAANVLSSVMNKIGIRTKVSHYREDRAPKKYQDNLVLVCGP